MRKDHLENMDQKEQLAVGRFLDTLDRIFDPVAAGEFREHGFASPTTARDWERAGFTGSSAAEWRDNGETSPAHAAAYRDARVSPAEAVELLKAHQANPTRL